MQGADTSQELKDRKILVVEDEMLVAMDYCDRLAAAGAAILGPYTSVSQALRCLAKTNVDVALLDHALVDETSDALQQALERRNIPYIIVSGYPRVLVRRDKNQQVLSKPVSPDLLCETIKAACAR